jgi:hypothetical protein
MNSAWLEPISSVVRVGAEGAKHLDDYHFAATVRYLDFESIEVVGVAKMSDSQPGITKADWVAMVECFRVNGIKRVLFKRVKNGTIREKWITIKEKK